MVFLTVALSVTKNPYFLMVAPQGLSVLQVLVACHLKTAGETSTKAGTGVLLGESLLSQ